MKILVYGAGVLGSLYAARLHEIGCEVTILARDKRYVEIINHGIILQHSLSEKRSITQVPVVDKLASEDMYDLILIFVRRDQVTQILPVLAANKLSGSIMFMVNNPCGYTDWINSAGRQRLLLGFAGAGGTRKDNVVYYHIVSPVLQPTTIAELDGNKSDRIIAIARLFRKAGFPTVICNNMEAWQKTHVAWVSPVANALYMAGGDGVSLSNRSDILKIMVNAIHEGFSVLKALNIPITPPKMKILASLPKEMVITIFQNWTRTKHFDTIATQHTLAAFQEMKMLSNDFQTLARSTMLSTPSLNILHQNLKNWKQ